MECKSFQENFIECAKVESSKLFRANKSTLIQNEEDKIKKIESLNSR